MSPDHQEELLDAGIAESFPASDPVSVYVDPPQPASAASRGEDGIAWSTWMAGALPALGLAAAGVRFVLARREAALRAQRRQQLALAGAAGGLVALALVARAKWRARREAEARVDLEEDPPLFV